MRAQSPQKSAAVLLSVIMCALCATGIGGQTPGPAPSPDKVEADRRDTIRYGIDTEVIGLLSDLASEKEARYNADLLELMDRTRNAKLRQSILDFFAGSEWKGAEASALKLVDQRDQEDAGLVASALSYLAAVRSHDALRYAKDIIKEDDKKLLGPLMKLLGRAGGPDEEGILLSWFEGDAVADNLREDAVRALGDIGSGKAAKRLGEIAADSTRSKGLRMLACEALGKIKDPASLGDLTKAANGDDPNVRTSAIEAMPAFASAEADAVIVEALRDSYAKVRIAACKGVGLRVITAALPILRYKAASDPEKAVRGEALRGMAVLGGEAFAFLRERMDDPKESPVFRVQCFGLLARKDAQGSMKALEARLSAEAASKDRSLYTGFAKEIANADDAPGAAGLARILLSDKDYLIRVAGVEWIRKNKDSSFKAELERLSKEDPAEMIRKRAEAALAAL
ncbi:MAG TPA: HEAT repeat domain-containing protein [Rectinemataceae bacterium]|nr:HEAT repeat domain-containing protein [Rectinemataceae bacterium]